jgi:hypothetical protein
LVCFVVIERKRVTGIDFHWLDDQRGAAVASDP